MRTVLFAMVAFTVAAHSAAAVTYDFRSVTTGIRDTTIAGRVEVEGPRIRFDVGTGDGMLFKDGAVVYSQNGGRTLDVVDRASKSYYELDFDQLLSNPTSALGQLGSMVKLTVTNAKVSAKDLGDGGKVEGYSTRHWTIDVEYDLSIDAMGTRINTHMRTVTESWRTSDLDPGLMNFLQLRGFRTGMPDVDKLIDLQTAAAAKGFPLKEVAITHVSQNGSDMVATTTSTVTSMHTRPAAANDFVLPLGLTKKPNPVESMLK